MIIFVYETYEAKYGHHPITEYLKSKGHKVICFDQTKVMTLNYRFKIFRRILDKYFNSIIILSINYSVKNIIKKETFDIAIIVRGEHLLPSTLSFMKKNN